VGTVTNNVDPDEMGRVQIKFPTMHEEPVSYWIRQISPNAGKERGLYALPEVEDEVLVMFMQGHVEHPVIIGQCWNGVDKPPPEAKDGMPAPTDSNPMTLSTDTFNQGSTGIDTNDRRLWKSRSGHLFVFDDTSGKETIQIWDKDHNLAFIFDSANQRILLTNKVGDIHIRTQRDLFLEAGRHMKWRAAQNIEGTSVMDTSQTAKNYKVEAQMDITLTASMNFNATADMNVSIKGSIGATVEGTTTATFKGGATATLQGGAMTSVKGGVVMIN
jgi:uncharacterized protein involved in type VI secretion and phage assembly